MKRGSTGLATRDVLLQTKAVRQSRACRFAHVSGVFGMQWYLTTIIRVTLPLRWSQMEGSCLRGGVLRDPTDLDAV